MTYEQMLRKATELAYNNHKEVEAVRLLLFELSGLSSSAFYLNIKNEVPKDFEQSFFEKLSLYIEKDIPVQHILGYSYFFGRKFVVNNTVLIPRPETEQLCENTLIYFDDYFNQAVDLLDLGTGSGCIATTLALEEPRLQVDAADISEEAINTARKTVDCYQANVNFIQSDWFSNIKKQYDIIISNPPYIPEDEIVESIVDKEPSLALYGGNKGLVFYDHILKNIKPFLKEKALIGFEHGYQQAKDIKAIALNYLPDATVVSQKDLAGKDRFTFIGLGGVLK